MERLGISVKSECIVYNSHHVFVPCQQTIMKMNTKLL